MRLHSEVSRHGSSIWSIWRPSAASPPLHPGGPADRAQPEAPGRLAAPFGRRGQPCGARSPAAGPGPSGPRAQPGRILLALLGFLPTVGGTNPVRFESDSILGMRILRSRSDFPTTGQYLAYQRDTYTNVTGRDL